MISTQYPSDIDYFEWDFKTGVVLLKRKLDKPIGHIFQLKATASDGGSPSKSTDMNINLEVTESSNKPPTFVTGPGNGILELLENYHDFGTEIATYTAESNIPDDPTVFFLLLNGRTEKTNKDGTFRFVQSQGKFTPDYSFYELKHHSKCLLKEHLHYFYALYSSFQII